MIAMKKLLQFIHNIRPIWQLTDQLFSIKSIENQGTKAKLIPGLFVFFVCKPLVPVLILRLTHSPIHPDYATCTAGINLYLHSPNSFVQTRCIASFS